MRPLACGPNAMSPSFAPQTRRATTLALPTRGRATWPQRRFVILPFSAPPREPRITTLAHATSAFPTTIRSCYVRKVPAIGTPSESPRNQPRLITTTCHRVLPFHGGCEVSRGGVGAQTLRNTISYKPASVRAAQNGAPAPSPPAGRFSSPRKEYAFSWCELPLNFRASITPFSPPHSLPSPAPCR